MSSDARVNNEPGFILHTYPFKETSVVAEVFTRSHGRVALIARGARRPASALRGLMQPFSPLLLSWFGKAELKTLHAAEWQGGLMAPQGRAGSRRRGAWGWGPVRGHLQPVFRAKGPAGSRA